MKEIERDNKSNKPEEYIELALSETTQEALQRALEEAQNFGGAYFIDTADLLIGLTYVDPTKRLLKEVGVTPERIREVKSDLGGYDYFNRLQPPSPPKAIQKWSMLPRTIRIHKIGRLVTQKAITDGKNIIEPEDVLNVILEEGQGLGAIVLKHMGLDKTTLFKDQA